MADDLRDNGQPRPRLLLQMAGARDDALARGLKAAEATLFRVGDVDPLAAMLANADGDCAVYDENDYPLDNLTDEQNRLAELWTDAYVAGVKACCAGWDRLSSNGCWLAIDTGSDTVLPWHPRPTFGDVESYSRRIADVPRVLKDDISGTVAPCHIVHRCHDREVLPISHLVNRLRSKDGLPLIVRDLLEMRFSLWVQCLDCPRDDLRLRGIDRRAEVGALNAGGARQMSSETASGTSSH